RVSGRGSAAITTLQKGEPLLRPSGESDLVRRDMFAFIGSMKQPAQFGLRGSLIAGKRFVVAVSADAPAQAPSVRAAFFEAAIPRTAPLVGPLLAGHHRFLAMIVARARLTPAVSGVSPGSHSSVLDGATGSPFGRIFESRVSTAYLKTAKA